MHRFVNARTASALLWLATAACAPPAVPASMPPPPAPAPRQAVPPPAPTVPVASAAPVDPATPPSPSESPSQMSATVKSMPAFPAPAGFRWVDQSGDFALAGKEPGDPSGIACEVIDTKTRKVVAKITGENTNAGGADPSCAGLSPAAHLVQIGNARGLFWKNWSNKTTACRGAVAPDDSSCVEDDVTPFMFAGKGGPDANLDLHWSKAIPNGATKKVATIPRGLNREGEPAWWTVRFCSAEKAVIDDPKGMRTEIDARTGSVKSSKKSDKSPLCP